MLVPDLFDASLIGNQLRCAGVIEAVRVSRLGYSQRYCHSSFITRYRVLGMRALSEKKKAGEK
jgi:myosin-5